MNRQSIYILLLIAATLVLVSYHTSFNLTVHNLQEATFAPPPIEARSSHYENPTNIIEQTGLNKSHAPNRSNKTRVDILVVLNLSIPIHNYKKDDPFAPQKRTGSVFHHDKHHPRFWWEHSNTCFAVDDICRASQNRWFYFHRPNSNSSITKSQPSFELKYMPYSYSLRTWADTRIQMSVQSSHLVPWEKIRETNQCSVSRIPYHVVLQSNYNDVSSYCVSRACILLVCNSLSTHYMAIDAWRVLPPHTTRSLHVDIQKC